MFSNEDDDASETLGAVRYAVMPSLVALQQMRNRLHLAYLGKKLMKWTAMATGKELRRLALQMAATFQNYAEDMGKAFMLLARSRYFVPGMSGVVLEDIGKSARITITSTTKSVSGVKVYKLELRDNSVDAYPYLGIGKGGTAISDAKEAWNKIIRLLVRIIQQRNTFKQVEQANKNATKKQNVLSRVIIPRIIVTMRYIGSELEEQEREETFRLKRFKQLKYKDVDVEQSTHSVHVDDETPQEEIKKAVKEEPIVEPMKGEPHVIKKPKEIKAEKVAITEAPKTMDDKMIKTLVDKIAIEDILADEKMTESLTHTSICACCLSLFVVDETGQFLCPICQLEAKAKEEHQEVKVDVVPCKSASPKAAQNKERLDHLMTHINEALELAEQYKSEGVKSSSMEEFIKTCGVVKQRIGEMSKPTPPCICPPTQAVPEPPVAVSIPCNQRNLEGIAPCSARSSAPASVPCSTHPSAPTNVPCSAHPSASKPPCICPPTQAVPEPPVAVSVPCSHRNLEGIAPCSARSSAPASVPCSTYPSAPTSVPCSTRPSAPTPPCICPPAQAVPEPPVAVSVPCSHKNLEGIAPCSARSSAPASVPCSTHPSAPTSVPCSTRPSAPTPPCICPPAQAVPEPPVAVSVPCSHKNLEGIAPCSARSSAPASVPCSTYPSAPTSVPCSTRPSAPTPPCICPPAQAVPEPPVAVSVPCSHKNLEGIAPCSARSSAPASVPCSTHPSAPTSVPCSTRPSAPTPPCICPPAQAVPEPPVAVSVPCSHKNLEGIAPCSARSSAPASVPCSTHPSAPTSVPCSTRSSAPISIPCSTHPSAPTSVPCSTHPSAPTSVPCSARPSAPIGIPCSARPSVSISVPCSARPSAPTSIPCGARTSAPTSVPCSTHPSAPTSVPCSTHPSAPTSVPCSTHPSAPTSVPCSARPSAPIGVPCSARPSTPIRVPCSAPASAPSSAPPSASSSAYASARTSARTTPVVSTQPSVCETCHPPIPPTTRETSHPPSICRGPAQDHSDTFELTPVLKPKLGFFEKKYKEIVKVTRLKNPDGTICEEKKVITIRTERRNPRNQDESEYKEQKYISACTTSSASFGDGGGYDEGGAPGGYNDAGGYTGAGGPDVCQRFSDPGKTNGFASSTGYDGGLDYGDNETESKEQRVFTPMKTRSEALKQNSLMGEPKLRVCLSSTCERSGHSSLSTNCETCICFDISKTTLPCNKIRVCSQKASKSTSVESKLCCPDCSRFVCSTELDSGPKSPNVQKYESKATSIQTCTNFELGKKDTIDKAIGCVPTCGVKRNRSDKMDCKCVNTDSLQSDRSCCSIRTDSFAGKRRAESPTSSCNSKCSKRNYSSGCSIKIISKAPKACSFEKKDCDSEIIIKGSMLNALRKMIIPVSKSTQCNYEGSENRNLCSMCQSKLTASSQKSQIRSRLNPSCYTCRARTDIEGEEELVKEICNFCGTLGKFSSSSALGSTRSCAAGSSVTGSSSFCSRKSKKISEYSFFPYYRPTCTSLAQTITRSVSYTSDKPSEISCPKRVWTKSVTAVQPPTNDAMTSTKRTERYDCRSLSDFRRGHACENIRSETCACHSDTHMLRQRSQSPIQQTQSYCDDLNPYQW